MPLLERVAALSNFFPRTGDLLLLESDAALRVGFALRLIFDFELLTVALTSVGAAVLFVCLRVDNADLIFDFDLFADFVIFRFIARITSDGGMLPMFKHSNYGCSILHATEFGKKTPLTCYLCASGVYSRSKGRMHQHERIIGQSCHLCCRRRTHVA